MIPLGVLASARVEAARSLDLIQTATAISAGTSTVTVTATIASTPGNLLVAYLANRYATTDAAVSGMTLAARAGSGSALHDLRLFTGPAGPSSVTASWTGGSQAALIVCEYDADAIADPTTAYWSAGSVPTVEPDALVIAGIADRDTITDGDVAVTSPGSVNARINLAIREMTPPETWDPPQSGYGAWITARLT